MRINIGKNIEVYFGIKRVGYVNGVNSEQPDGRHILMWDFDEVDYVDAIRALRIQQTRRGLGYITILDTRKEFKGQPGTIKNLHAYCFRAMAWRDAFQIVWDTPFVCATYLKMAFAREFFTLRFSDKAGRKSDLLAILPGPKHPDDVDPATIGNFVRYRTKVK